MDRREARYGLETMCIGGGQGLAALFERVASCSEPGSPSSPAPPAASARPPPQRLAADGFAVAVLDLKEDDARDTVEAIEAAGGRALAVGADVGDAEQVQAAVDRIAAELGPPVVLVNNAGVTRDNLLFKMTDADWDLVMHVHLRGSFLMTRAVQKHMIEAKWGRIVNLSSTSALGNRGQANYATAKAGLQGFTKTLAIELGKFGVTANAIAPGLHRHRHDEGDRRADRPGVGALRGRRAPRRSRWPGPASPRTSRTPCRSSSARARASSPARSSTSPAARRPEGPSGLSGHAAQVRSG